MLNTNRRTFVINSVLGAGALATATVVHAQAKLTESDAQATALGYKEDATKADKTKYPKYAAGQTCGNCGLFQGKAGDAMGGCPLFAGKQVASKGWCSAWIAKA